MANSLPNISILLKKVIPKGLKVNGKFSQSQNDIDKDVKFIFRNNRHYLSAHGEFFTSTYVKNLLMEEICCILKPQLNVILNKDISSIILAFLNNLNDVRMMLKPPSWRITKLFELLLSNFFAKKA